jgi:hypothetical protein
MIQINFCNAYHNFQNEILFQYSKISCNIKVNFDKISDNLSVSFWKIFLILEDLSFQ